MKKNSQTKNTGKIVREFEADVLFQKIFNKWYAFSVIDGECHMTEVREEDIEHFKAHHSSVDTYELQDSAA